MGITRIQDVIQPEIFTPYVTEKTMELSEFIKSGIIKNDSEFNQLASGPNTLINMPYWNDLTGDSEVLDDEGYFTPANITASKDVARKIARGKTWGVNNLSALLSGDDPSAAIGNLVANYWQREMQKIALSMLKGVFSSDSMADKSLDISSLSGNASLICGETFIDAGQKMGDAKELLTAITMHSAVEAYLAKRNLIEYVQESEQSDRVPYFMGKRVVVDDGMPFDTATKTGVSYVFGAGAIALGNGSHPKIKESDTEEDKLSFAGEDYLINRKIFMLHLRGVKWTEKNIEGNFPTNEELENGENWERVFEPKKIRVVKFVYKIS